MWRLDPKEGWVPKNWCFWAVVLEKTLESPLNCKAIKPVNPKGNQSWILIGRTDSEAEVSILWPPDVKGWLIEKDSDAGKDWRQKNRVEEDEVVRWYHRLNGHELSKLWEMVEDREAWRAAVHEVIKSWTRLSNWTKTTRGRSCSRGDRGKHFWNSMLIKNWHSENEHTIIKLTSYHDECRK